MTKISLDLERMKATIEQMGHDAVIQMAQGLVVSIRQRVAAGYGVDDQPMDPYSTRYAVKKGRTGPRDLLLTSHMLRSIYVHTTIYGAVIAFSDALAIAKAKGNQARTPWWGISPKDREKMKQLIERIKRGGA